MLVKDKMTFEWVAAGRILVLTCDGLEHLNDSHASLNRLKAQSLLCDEYMFDNFKVNVVKHEYYTEAGTFKRYEG